MPQSQPFSNQTPKSKTITEPMRPAGSRCSITIPTLFLLSVFVIKSPAKRWMLAWAQAEISLYLASHGWDVTGFDIADAGVAQARTKAKKLGIKLNAIVKSDTDFDFGTNQWDLIVLTYQPFRDLLSKLKPSLKDGGIVVIENFHRDTMRDRLLDEDATYRNNELLDLFSDFRILRYEDTVARPDWGIEFPKIGLSDLKRRRAIFNVPAAIGRVLPSPRRPKFNGE